MIQRGMNRLAGNLSGMRRHNDNENKWYGDNLEVKKHSDNIRMVYHNIRGMSLKGTEGLEMFIHEQSALEIDLQAFSEHCLDTTKFYVQHEAKNILRSTYQGQAMIHLSSSQEPAVNQYKPGGTGILILGTTTSKLEPNGRGSDPMGRWSYVHLRRKNLPPVTVLSVYQVCPRPTNPVGNTAFHQQQRTLNAANRTVHPRKAFIQDLDNFLRHLRNHGHDIILGGDFNESLDDKNSGLLALAITHQLIDVFLHRFPHHPTFGTHLAGNRRIDSVFVTERLTHSLTAVGYAPFDYASTSDHRPVVLEFKTDVLFGKIGIDLQHASTRALKTNDTIAVTRFVNATYQALERHQAFTYQSELDNDTASCQIVELLDAIIGSSEATAEQKCRKRRPEFYSRTIVQQRITVSILRAHLNALRLQKDRTHQLRQKMKRTGIEVPLPPTQRMTQLALTAARSQLQETCRTSFTTRQAELSSKILAAQQEGDRTKSKILKAMKKVEEGHRMFRILKAIRCSRGESSQLDRLEIPMSWPTMEHDITELHQLEDPKTCKEWRLITEPSEIEYYLLLRNRLHFGQAEGTPFTTLPLSDSINWEASTSDSEQILQGEYSITTDTPQLQDLLSECTARHPLNSIAAEVTLDEFCSKLNVWRESTTTSPSGRHLGRYKAYLKAVVITEAEHVEGSPTFAQKQEAILKLKLSIMNYCIRNTYVLERWKTVVNVMIFKEPGNFKIHRLRVIHIYEADFNLILAVKWRTLVQFADKHNTINEGQYGGRPGCEAQSLTLLEELKYDISYMSRRSLFNFDNDASSCYDRIIVPLASLINRKYGLHQRMVAVHAATLREAKFRLKTAAGISDTAYSHCRQFPIHGTGQGSGNSPSIWLFISSTLFDIHTSKSFGATFLSPDGKTKVNISMVGFVDDSTGSCNDFRPQTQDPLVDLFRRMEHDAQLWNNLLHCTGGKLELPKCSFHVLHFEFDPNGKPRPTIDKHENCIHVRDSETNANIAISAKRSFETHKTLGHHKSPHTNTREILREIQHKANHLATLIAMSPITRQGAQLAYHTIYMPSIKYSLPQSFYTRSDLDEAQSSSVTKIIAKCGYNRRTARAIIYGPISFAGGGFIPWHLLQGEGQVLQFLKHWRTNTMISTTLRIAVQWAQWQSGHNQSILDDTTTPILYLECRWLRSLRDFLASIDAHIRFHTSIVVTPERSQDIYIMPFARTCGLFTEKELEVVNYCRLYLHVTTLSELLDVDGTKIIPQLFDCQREPWFNPKMYITLQRRPTDYHIKYTWQRLCRQWIASDGSLAASIQLGKWITTGAKLRRRRQTYINANDNQVYHWRYGRYWTYKPSKEYSTVYVPDQATDWEPDQECFPLQAFENVGGHIAIKMLNTRTRKANRPVPPAKTFTEYVLRLPRWEKDLILGVNKSYEPFEIVHRLITCDIEKEILLVSDGSQHHHSITYGWVLGTATGTKYAEHSGAGHGTLSSHRAEAWGMLSGLVFLHHIFQYTQMDQTTDRAFQITCYSDNNGLIQRVNQRRAYSACYPNSTLAPDWDLIEQIYNIATKLPRCTIQYKWVKGHQDDTSDDLSMEALYNIRADELAGQYQNTSDSTDDNSSMPSERCRFFLGNRAIHGHYTQEIRQSYMLPPLFAYLTKRHGWTDTTIQSIDWEAFQSAARNCQIPQVQLVKLVHDKLPTRAEQAKSNPHIAATCSYCVNDETFYHILQCDNPISNKFRQELHNNLDTYFHITQTPLEFSDMFQRSDAYWYNLQEHNTLYDDTQSQVYHEQNVIGWPLLLKGYMSTQWGISYQQACKKNNSIPTKSASDYMAGIIRILWTSQLALWDAHLQHLHKTSTTVPLQCHGKLQEYKTRIRILHRQQHLCIHAHREQYFFPDLEGYLQNATLSQMKSYLFHYEAAIIASQKEAQKQSTHTLWMFPGFTRTNPIFHLQSTQAQRPRIHYPSNRIQLDTRGDLIPHKHTRWKKITATMRGIKEYFQQPAPT